MANSKKQYSLLAGWLICLLGALFYTYEYLLRIEPSVMVPELMRSFAIHADQFGLLVSLYYIAYTPMQLVVGTMADIYGARRILTIAIAICVIGSLIFSTTQSVYIAASGRFLIGFGSAFAFVGVLKLASVWLPNRHFALAAGLTTSLGMIGAMTGDIEMAKLVGHVGYKTTLYIGTIAGAILLPIFWLTVRDHPQGNKRIVLKKHQYRKTVLSLLKIIKSPQMWIAGFIGCVLYLSLSVFGETWGSTYLQQAHHLSNEQGSNLVSMVFLGWLIGGPFNGWLSDKLLRRKLILTIGLLVTGIIFLLILYLPYHNTTLLHILLILFGISSSTEVLCFAIGRELCPQHLSGTAVAFINMLVMLGGFVFQPLVAFLLDYNWTGIVVQHVRVYSADDFKTALLIIPIGCLIASILIYWLKDTTYLLQQEKL